jgi:formate hydrogenlyase subunit 4
MTWTLFVISFLFLSFIITGLIRKAKALLQNRVGASLFQPLFNFIKLMLKGEVISEDASWLFRVSTAINLAIVIVAAFLLPWLSFKPPINGDDLFLFIYLFGTARFLSILAALDTGSPFGAFSSSRDITLSLLVEPAIVLSLIAIALGTHSTSLGEMFSYKATGGLELLPVWLMAGTGIFLSSIVELSRMPIDDPTTHLELTMVHEAMIVENSGRNLALQELTYSIRMVIFYGLTVQCFLHSLATIISIDYVMLGILSILGIFVVGIVIAFMETFMVKLQWTKCPEFIAYALTMSLFACMAAILRRGIL